MLEDSPSVLARKIDFLGGRILLLFFFLFLFNRFLPPAPGTFLAAVITFALHQLLRTRTRRRLTRLAQHRRRNKWWEETRKKLATMEPEELASWAAPYLAQTGLSHLACPLPPSGVHLLAILGQEQVVILCLSTSDPITKNNLQKRLEPLSGHQDRRILVISTSSFTLEAHHWARSNKKQIKILDRERLLELAWQFQQEEGTHGHQQKSGRPLSLAELQHNTWRRLFYGIQSVLFLGLWSFFLGGWLRYYYLAAVLFTLGLLLYLYRLALRYRSLASPNWETWQKNQEQPTKVKAPSE